MEGKTVLVVHNFYQIPGGEDAVVANEIELLEKCGRYKVVSYFGNNSLIKKFSIWRKCCLPFIALFSFRTYKDVIQIIKKQKIDVIHVHNTLSLISPSVYYAARRCKVPVVQTLHNYRLICPNGILYNDEHICEECIEAGCHCAVKYRCYRNSRIQTIVNILIIKVHKLLGIYNKLNFVCLTDFQKEKIMRHFPKACFFVKPNFTYSIDNFVYNKRNMERSYYIYIGRMEKNKGIWKLLEAFGELTDLELLMVGTGVEEKEVKSYLNRKKMHNVKYCGFQDKEWITEHLLSAKALIQPSQCYETFGMTVIESFACGTPVIVSDVGVFADFVKGKGTGLLFHYDSSKDLREKILYMEENSDFQIQAGAKAYQMWKECYSPEINLREMEKIYSKVQEK